MAESAPVAEPVVASRVGAAEHRGRTCQWFSFATGGCRKTARWRMDLVCDTCGPRVGLVCGEHLEPARERMHQRYLRCQYASGRCYGFIVSVVFVELV